MKRLPRTSHEGTEGGVDGVGGKRHAPAALPPERHAVPFV
jgi:hypothetical protein